MTDRELLELAAKAAGYAYTTAHFAPPGEPGDDWGMVAGVGIYWNPLVHAGQALLMAVQLGMSITPYPVYREDGRHSVIVKQRRRSDTLRESNPTEVVEIYGDDPQGATRRAIVRAAAEIGRAMP